jgi:hypothetical protein
VPSQQSRRGVPSFTGADSTAAWGTAPCREPARRARR